MEAEWATDHGGKWQDAAAAGVTSCGSDVPLECLFALTLTTVVHYGCFHSSDYIVVSNEVTTSLSLWTIYFNFPPSESVKWHQYVLCVSACCKIDRGYSLFLQFSKNIQRKRSQIQEFFPIDRPFIICLYCHKFQSYWKQCDFLMLYFYAKAGVSNNLNFNEYF